MRVRVVEDDKDIARWLAIALGDRDDLEFVATTEGFTALFQPEAWHRIDGAIVDVQLGSDITGLSVLRYLAGEFPHIRRVALTASWPVDERVKDMADVTLEKPSSADEIFVALRGGAGGD